MNILDNNSVAAVAIILLISACGSGSPRLNPDKEHELSDQFDGRWVLQLDKNEEKCKYNYVNRTYLNVGDGIGKIQGGKEPIGRKGDFKISSKVVYSTGAVNLIFTGNLESGQGYVLVDYLRSKQPSCRAAFIIDKVP